MRMPCRVWVVLQVIAFAVLLIPTLSNGTDYCYDRASVHVMPAAPGGVPVIAVHQESPAAALLMRLTVKGWETETLADAPKYEKMGLWADGTDLLVCYFPAHYMECRSTAPIVGVDFTPAGDDDDDNDHGCW